MSSVVTALTDSTTGLTASTFTGAIAEIVPLIVMLVPICLGLYFLRRLVSGAARAKVKF